MAFSLALPGRPCRQGPCCPVFPIQQPQSVWSIVSKTPRILEPTVSTCPKILKFQEFKNSVTVSTEENFWTNMSNLQFQEFRTKTGRSFLNDPQWRTSRRCPRNLLDTLGSPTTPPLNPGVTSCRRWKMGQLAMAQNCQPYSSLIYHGFFWPSFLSQKWYPNWPKNHQTSDLSFTSSKYRSYLCMVNLWTKHGRWWMTSSPRQPMKYKAV